MTKREGEAMIATQTIRRWRQLLGLRRYDHKHEWMPWAEMYGATGRKVFSNGRGCRICHLREGEA